MHAALHNQGNSIHLMTVLSSLNEFTDCRHTTFNLLSSYGLPTTTWWQWKRGMKQEIQVQFLCCIFTVWVPPIQLWGHTFLVFYVCGLRATTLITFMCICHLVFPSILLRKENKLGNKINVLWLLIRNCHLTSVLKPLSNKVPTHKRML